MLIIIITLFLLLVTFILKYVYMINKVFEIRNKALNITAKISLKINNDSWIKAYEILNSYGSYEHMIFNSNIFTSYDELYPDLEKRLNELLITSEGK